MSVARFMADHKTIYRVPHTITCVLLEGEPGLVLQVAGPAADAPAAASGRPRRRRGGDVRRARLHGSPRLHPNLPTADAKLYLATVIDLYSRRLLAAATSLRCAAELCEQAIKIAGAVRGGKSMITNVVFHTDRGSTCTARSFTRLCSDLGVVSP